MKKLSPQCHGPLLYTAVIFSLLVICILFSNTGCKKNDFSTSGVNPIADIKQKFFYDHRSADPIEKNLVEYIRSQNEQLDFVGKTANQIGYPRWNKTIAIAQKKGSTSSFGSGSDSITLYYIPFVRDSQNYVNASMVISASATDTSFWYNCDWQYRQLNNSTSNQVGEAEQFAFLFMRLDNAVFGHKKFSIIDTTLFNNNKDTIATSVQLDTIPPNVSQLFSVLSCQNVLITYQVPCNLRQAGQTSSTVVSRIAWPKCNYTTWLYLCFPEDENIPGGGGGGGTGGGGTPPDCDEPQGRGIVARGNLPCEDGPGWEPEPPILPIEDPYDPCEVLKTKNTDTAYINKINYLKTKTNLTVETGFSESKTGLFTALVPTQSTNNSDNLNAPIDSTTRGFSHTHLNNYETQINEGAFSQRTAFKTPIRMFSPADVNQLMLLTHRNRFSGDYSQYYITMVTTNGTYTLKFTGSAADIKLGFGTDQWRRHFVNAFEETPQKGRNTPVKLEKFFLKYLKETMQINSMSLYKINDNGTVDEKKLDVAGEVISIPCP